LYAASAGAAALNIHGGVQAEETTKPWDVIVVGGGNSGLPAAIFAAQRGAKVLLVESAGQVGGTLFLSTGQMSAAGTKLQKSKGIEDTPQSHFDDVMRISKGTANPVLVRLAVDHAAAAFDWLTDNGLVVHPDHPITGTTHDPYSRPRYAWGMEGGMSILKILVAQLEPHLKSGQVTLLTQTEVTELIQQKDGTVTGVVTRNSKGETKRQSGKYTVLTCGGYTFNPKMYQELEGAKDYSQATYPESMGAGIKLGVAAGGYVRGGEMHTPLFGAVLAGYDYPSPVRALARNFPTDREPWEIIVNVHGKRFVQEDIPSHDAYEQGLRAQPDERCWVVFDDEIFKKAPTLVHPSISAPWTPQDTVDAFKSRQPMFFTAATIPELAKLAGVDVKGLTDTVADYNRGQAAGKDALGRTHMPLPIKSAPFYAIQLQSWNLNGYAGLVVDGQLRVVRQDGRPIPNLYAAGELLGTAALMGRGVSGGMMVTPALAFGRLLGNDILKFG
jgi:fumarate reductase flavoprotein subunit